MFERNRSGQFIYWAFTNISGNLQTGISGSISGVKVLDGTASHFSGNIIEAGGRCQANLFDADTNGNCIGYFFQSSGCVPVSFTVTTQQNTSGKIYPASGINTTVPPSSLSGVIANSGIFANVPIASISGLNAVVPKENLSGVVANSGLFVTATATVVSGDVYLASGHFGFPPHSGLLHVASGPFANVPPATLSGVTVAVVNANLSGINAIVPTASLSGVVANSGLNVTVPIASISGVRSIAESGTVFPASGIVAPWPFTHEGTALSGTAGTIQLATTATSGANFYLDQLIELREGTGAGQARTVVAFNGESKIATVAPSWEIVPSTDTVYGLLPDGRKSVLSGQTPASLSGLVVNSGLFVTVPVASISGTNAVVPPATLSGVVANSGLFATVPKETLSGVVANSGLFVTATATVASGDVWLASGHYEFLSGINAIVPKATLSGVVANSGLNVTADIRRWVGTVLTSVYFDLTYGNIPLVAIISISGVHVTVPIETVSGVNVGTVHALRSGGLSGHTVDLSGIPAVVPPSTLSGVVANSGLFASVPLATISGANVNVLPETLSGTRVVIGSGQLSGHVLEHSIVETGLDAIQALRVIGAATAGQLSGAGTSTIVFQGANASGTARLTATVDASGNRTAITLNL